MMRARIIVGAQLADLAAFMVAVSAVGIAGEANPLAAMLYGIGGMGAIVALKVTGALVLGALAYRLGRWWLLPAWAGILGALTALWAVL